MLVAAPRRKAAHNHLFSASTADTPSIIDTRSIPNLSAPELPKGSTIRALAAGDGTGRQCQTPCRPHKVTSMAPWRFLLGAREARRLEWTGAGPTGTVEGRTRGDVCRLHAVHSAGLLAEEVGLEITRENSVFRAVVPERVPGEATLNLSAELFQENGKMPPQVLRNPTDEIYGYTCKSNTRRDDIRVQRLSRLLLPFLRLRRACCLLGVDLVGVEL